MASLTGGRDQRETLGLQRGNPNYLYLALFVYQLMEDGLGIDDVRVRV